MNDTFFTPIQPLWDKMPLMPQREETGSEGNQSVFGAIFASAMDNVRQTEDEKNKLQYSLATGQLDNPAELMIAASKYQTSVDLLVQLRNKALDAYSELSRISL